LDLVLHRCRAVVAHDGESLELLVGLHRLENSDRGDVGDLVEGDVYLIERDVAVGDELRHRVASVVAYLVVAEHQHFYLHLVFRDGVTELLNLFRGESHPHQIQDLLAMLFLDELRLLLLVAFQARDDRRKRSSVRHGALLREVYPL